jgi:cell division protein ZipA
MDMNLRELLIVVGIIFIAGIVADGFRRMRRAKKDSLEMSIGMGGEIENTPIDDGFNPELPNGGARKIGDFGDMTAEVEVPVSSRKVSPTTASSPIINGGRVEPLVGEVAPTEGEFNDENLSSARVVARKNEKDVVSSDVISTETRDVSVAKQAKIQPKEKITFGAGLKSGISKAKQSNAKQIKEKSVKKTAEKDKAPKPAQEVIILNVMSKAPEGFSGLELKSLLEACGLEHGEMSIFHRHENAIDSPIQFSVANAVEPGYFPKDLIDTLTTPGISFFMSLPGPDENMKAFDYMVETAQCVVTNLSGEMKDERRSDMTPQTLEHCRQRIRDFERRQLMVRC